MERKKERIRNGENRRRRHLHIYCLLSVFLCPTKPNIVEEVLTIDIKAV